MSLAGMTADEFIPWAMQQPERDRFQLVAGKVVPMPPERASHARCKGEIFLRLRQAIETLDTPCEVFTDGMAVRIDANTVYEPDVSLRAGRALDDDAVEFSDPIIVVEILSPSSAGLDVGAKLEDYFRLPSVRHYLIVRTQTRTIIHHARDDRGVITTHILRDSPVTLDPPGLVLKEIFRSL